MRARILGCGTSTGVPVPGCRCAVCVSKNLRNERLRTSLFLELQEKDRPDWKSRKGGEEVIARVLIDTGPDLRMQLLREDIREVDFVLYTHTHADHIFGIDDLRGICFSQKHAVAGYASPSSVSELRHYFPYIFSPDPAYMGGAPPNVELTPVEPLVEFEICGVPILPVRVLHGTMEILGYRIGSLGYVTDCSEIPEDSREALANLNILFLSGLRIRPHPTHFSLEQAYRAAETLAPKRAVLIHLSHDVDFERESQTLKSFGSLPVELAYDGLRVEL